MNKRFASISLAIYSLSLLTSCGKKESEKLNISKNSDAYNNWYYVSSDENVIYNDQNRATIMEYSDMNNCILCNIPNCSHNSSDCLVNISKSTSQLPVIYNNCAYYFINSDSQKEVDGKLCLDLKTKIEKYDFAEHTITDIAEISGFNANFDQGCYLSGSTYYFTTNYGNPLYDEVGNVVSNSNGGGGNLFSVDLKNGEVTDYGEIFDYEKLKKEYPSAQVSTSLYLMGKINNKLYIRISYIKDDIIDESVIGNSDIWAGMTFTFDIDKKEFNKINDNFSICAMNDYLTYTSSGSTGKLIAENIKTGETAETCEILSPNAVTVINNKIWHDSKCYDIATGKEKDIDASTCISVYNDSYVLFNTNEIKTVPCKTIDDMFK